MPDKNINQQNSNGVDPQGDQIVEQPSTRPSFIDKNSSLVSNRNKNNQQENDSSQKLAKTAAKGAAAYLGGPIGAKAVDALSKTKAGQQMLNKGGQALSRMPGMKKGAQILDKTGATDKADKAIDVASGGKPDLSSGGKPADMAKTKNNNSGGSEADSVADTSSSNFGKLNPFSRKRQTAKSTETDSDDQQKAKLSLPFIGNMSLTTKVIAIGAIISVFLLFFLILALFGIKRFDPMFANDEVKYSSTGYTKDGKDGEEDGKKGAYFVGEDEITSELYEKINKVSEKYDNNSKTIRRGLAAIYTVIRDNEDYFPDDALENFEDELKKMAKMINQGISDEIDNEDGTTSSDTDTTEETTVDNDDSTTADNAEDSNTSDNSSSRVIWVGDSRFVQMFAHVNNNDWSHTSALANGYEKDNDFWVAKGSQSYGWFDSSAVKTVTSNLKSGDTIVINMGLNGIKEANKYVERINKLVDGDWKDANVVFMSVNPVNDSRSGVKNKDVEAFNEIIKSKMSSKVRYLDTYSTLYSTLSTDPNATTPDGFHYPLTETNKKIYELGRNSVGSAPTDNSNDCSIGIEKDWLKKKLIEYFKDSLNKELSDKNAEVMADEVIENIEDYMSLIGETCDDTLSGVACGDAAEVVRVARAELDNKSNPSRIGGEKYLKYVGLVKGYAWCASFVSWVANEAGISHDIIEKSAAVQSHIDYYRKQGTFHERGSGYKPNPGDLVLWKDRGNSHIAIVEKLNEDGKTVHIMEGNWGNSLNERDVALDNPTGFASPNYSSSSVCVDVGYGEAKTITVAMIEKCKNTKEYLDLVMPVYNYYGKKYGIRFPGVLALQSVHESGVPTNISNVLRKNNNMGGLKYSSSVRNATQGTPVPRNEGHSFYSRFASVDKYIDAQSYIIAHGSSYTNVMKKTNVNDFARNLLHVWVNGEIGSNSTAPVSYSESLLKNYNKYFK